jgi:N-terminal domain of toast_rack, DUF2154/Cell wall-active antibiotics response 4TMS YvqF
MRPDSKEGHEVTRRSWVLILIAVLMKGCSTLPVGDVELDNQKVELGQAKSVRAEIHIGAGALHLSGGAKPLLDADFIYNVSKWKPEVSYEVQGEEGKLRVRQPSVDGLPRGDSKYEWNLSFNNRVPLDLRVELGAGKSTLLLGDLSLTKLEVETGVGETTIDLNGEWKRDLNARIEGGIGQLNVHLPCDTAVAVEAEKGIGTVSVDGLRHDGKRYVNDAFGKTTPTLHIHIQAGIGEIRLTCK